MPNRTLHRFRPVQALPRAGLRLLGARYITPSDWRFACYVAASLGVGLIVWVNLAVPAACTGSCLSALLK